MHCIYGVFLYDLFYPQIKGFDGRFFLLKLLRELWLKSITESWI